MLVPGIGIVTSGPDAGRARVTRDLYHRAIAVQDAADAMGGFRSLSESEAFAIEYWPLERYKLAQAPPRGELAGKIALVTGGASGIGRAAARVLASRGAHVVVADLNVDGAQEVADEIVDAQGFRRAIAVEVDVTREDAVQAVTNRAVLEYGGIDILVASAGLATSAPITETTLEDWERNYAVLARGYFLAARETFRVMVEQGSGGSIVFVASKNALVAGANAAAYSSAKAASLHLARCLAEEGGPQGIRVNTVNPDAVIEGSSIWSSEWKAERANAYGVAEDDLQSFYRSRTQARRRRLSGGRRRGNCVPGRTAIDEVDGQRDQRRRRRDGRVPTMTRTKGGRHATGSRTARSRRVAVIGQSMHERGGARMVKANTSRGRLTIVAVVGLLVAAMVTAAAFAAGGASSKGRTFYFIPKDTLNPYEVIADRGGKIALTALGEKQVVSSGTEDTAAAQQPAIQAAIQSHAAGIVIAGNDPQAVCPALKQAQAQGTKIIAFDSDVNCRSLFINQADTETIGRSQIKLLAKLMAYKGQFAILSAASTATNQNAWIKYMKLELKKPAYKNMKLVKIYYGNDNPAQSRQATVAMLQAYPNLKGIESPTTVGISSAAQYLSTSKYKKKVVLTGLGLPSQMKKYVHDGTVTAFALWNPEDLGYLAGYAIVALADGKITGKVGETFKAGKLGTYKIVLGPDKRPQVILGPPYVFTIKNVDRFKF